MVQRTDLALAGDDGQRERARRLALFDNRSSELGLDWDAAALVALREESRDVLDGLFYDDEVVELEIRAELDAVLDEALGLEVDPEETKRNLGNAAKMVRVVVSLDDLRTFEDALTATGMPNRGEALAEVCKGYLNPHGWTEG